MALSTSERGWYILAISAGGRFGWHSARGEDVNETANDEMLEVTSGTALEAAEIKGYNESCVLAGIWNGLSAEEQESISEEKKNWNIGAARWKNLSDLKDKKL